ncbi:MAG TPA: hypothetical protein VNO13_05365 [Candidatus Udaeobacter sp.]|nr:hypothetical protein [Candidatus Udaeobacter sp.]
MAKKKKPVKKAKKKAAPRKPKKPAKKPVKKQVKKAKSVSMPASKKTSKKKTVAKPPRGKANSVELVGYQRKGLGSFTGGQSGDIQGISGRSGVDSDSVTELLEEGQTFEAEAVSGVENAADPDVSEVVTHQFPEDDVPEEYQDPDKD